MFGLPRKHKDVLYGVVYDIGSESVGVAIVESDHESESPVIVFSHRVQMRITLKTLTAAERMRQMREALFSASLIVSRDGLEALTAHNKHGRIDEICITVSAPWSYTLSRNVTYDGEAALKITRTLIDDLVTSAESEISTHLESNKVDPTIEYTIVERATVDVRINDYAVKQPIGLYGQEVSLVHVTGLIPTEILNAVEEVEEKIFPNTHTRSHTFLLVLYCVVRELFEDHDAITLINVTGETTEFGIVERGTLVESISVPYGLNTIVRSLMTKEGQTAKEIYSQLEMYHDDSLVEGSLKGIESRLDEYVAALTKGILEHASSRRFPKQAFVLAPASFSQLFSKVLAPFVKTSLDITTEILTIRPEELGVTNTKDNNDTNLAITSRFFHKLHVVGEMKGD